MSEEIKDGQEAEVVEETQEQTQGEDTQPEELSTSEQPTEESEEATLPDDAKECTKEQFEKLKASNAELKRRLDEQGKLPSVLDFLGTPATQVPEQTRQQYVQPVQMPQVYSHSQQQEQSPSLIDEQGYVNSDVLKSQLEEAKIARQRAEDAEERARKVEERVARFEIDAQTQKLYESYPELDPGKEVFNRDAYDLVKNEVLSQLTTTGNRDALEAAKKMSRYFRTQPEQVKTKKVLEQRNQASVSGVTPMHNSGEDLSDLKVRSRRDPDAMTERLKRLGM